MAASIDDIEARFRIALPQLHRRALLDIRDPIHKKVELLTPDGNECHCIFLVNEGLRACNWKSWPDYLVAFATFGCGDYFAYDVRAEPYRVHGIFEIGTAGESMALNEKESAVLPDFNAWYEYIMFLESPS